MLPFGIQIKGLVVGLLLAYFVLPWVLQFVNRSRNPRDAGTA